MPALTPPLGGLSPKAFLGGYWQKRPLLVRQAVPCFEGLIEKRDLFTLAGKEDVESRLVLRSPDWQVASGPFGRRHLSRLPATNWTLLVNDLNLHCKAADALLRRFSFASWARLDDVMISFAVPGGGVGPHADSYDVFLLQGRGRRRWRLMPPGRRPFSLLREAPLKLIAHFRPAEEMTLDPGDMLYLPPGWGHEGTALETCETYSIGFRAPGATELSTAFLDFLHERGFADGAYSDPGRKPASHPARIDEHLLREAGRTLAKIRWTDGEAAEFMGRYLSEPKQQVVFEPPARPLSPQAFLRSLRVSTVRVDPRTRMLFRAQRIYINGASLRVERRSATALHELADDREITGARLARQPTADLIYDWYRAGFLSLEKNR